MDENEIVVGGRYVIQSRAMISAVSEAEAFKFKMVHGKSGLIWLYNDDVKGCGAHIYVEGGKGSRGFGGSTIKFQLVGGSTIQLKGPWRCNPDAMFSDTGIDLRERHITFGVIGKDRGNDSNTGLMSIEDVIYFDAQPTEGNFSRIERLANQMVLVLGKEVAYYSESHGGSQCGFTRVLK